MHPACIRHDDVGRGLVCNQISPLVTNNLRDFQWRLLFYVCLFSFRTDSCLVERNLNSVLTVSLSVYLVCKLLFQVSLAIICNFILLHWIWLVTFTLWHDQSIISKVVFITLRNADPMDKPMSHRSHLDWLFGCKGIFAPQRFDTIYWL